MESLMPRTTYHDRFAALLAKDYVSDRDRSFAESLYSHYKRKGSLTAGRRRCFIQLEERYAVRPKPAAGIDKIDVLKARIAACDPGSWDENFVTSVRTQLVSGRTLSPRQTQIMEAIQEKYNDEAMKAREDWRATWNSEKAERYAIAMAYYRSSGYYTKQVSAYFADTSVVPTMTEYNRVTENKFINKIYTGWYADPKFPVGSMVALGAGATYHMRRSCPNKDNLAIVVATNAAVPTSAARGNKIYKLLPVGGAQTFVCEERQLKRARVSKKK
jgi:hypothetical protein